VGEAIKGLAVQLRSGLLSQINSDSFLTSKQELIGRICGGELIFSITEQTFFAQRKLKNIPKRCHNCRVLEKTKRTTSIFDSLSQALCEAYGTPTYLGYVTSAFKTSTGTKKANPHQVWENKIASRVNRKVIDELKKVNPHCVLEGHANKIGDVKHFYSLAAKAQEVGLDIGSLKGHVNPGYVSQVKEENAEFLQLAKEIVKRSGI